MKKWISLLLAVCLLLTSVSAMAASVSVTSSETVTGTTEDGELTSVASMTAIGGTAYLLYYDGRLTAVDAATGTETKLGDLLYSGGLYSAQAVSDALTGDRAGRTPADMLLSDSGKLYALCLANGALSALVDETGAFAPQATGVTADTSALVNADAETTPTVLDHCVMDHVLYFVTRDSAGNQMTTATGSIDLTTGQAKTYATQNLQNVQPYKDGKLLARRFDMSAMYAAATSGTGENMPASDYGTFDPKADAYAQLGEIVTDSLLGGYAINGMVYSAEKDSLYYVNGSRIEGLTLATGETRTSAYTGEGMFGNYGGNASTAYAEGGYYLLGDYSGLKKFALDTDAVKKGALRIFGEFGSDAHKSFATNYPDIPVDVASEYSSNLEALANAMVSESDAYDVLLLMMSYMPVERLIQKGYCSDLSAYPEIVERVAKLDPRFVAGVTVDGKLYGAPVTSMALSYGVDMEQWEALGLTQDDLPTNLIELYDFVANYMEDYGEDHPDLRLFDMGGDQLKTLLFSLMLDNYITYSQAKLNGEAEFDSDLFRSVLNAFEQIDFDPITENSDMTNTDYLSKPYLFASYLPVTSFSDYYSKITPMVLSLTADTEPVIGANLSVLIINPKSQRKDDAVKYVCNYLDNLDDSSAIVLNPNDNEPRVAKDYDKNLKAINDEIAKQQALLDAAEESQKAAIQDQLEQLNLSLKELEAHKYSVSQEQITRFREQISNLLVVCQQSVLYGSDENSQNELSKLILQYLSGATSQDQFLKEMDKRVRMMTLENQ